MEIRVQQQERDLFNIVTIVVQNLRTVNKSITTTQPLRCVCLCLCTPVCMHVCLSVWVQCLLKEKCGITENSHLVFALFCPQALSHVGPQLRFGEIKPERSVVRHFEKKWIHFVLLK